MSDHLIIALNREYGSVRRLPRSLANVLALRSMMKILRILRQDEAVSGKIISKKSMRSRQTVFCICWR